MKISFKREPLANAFQLAAHVAPSRTTKEILQNIRITANQGKAVLEATDQETSIRVHLDDVEIISPGSVLLPVQRTGGILRESSDEQMTLEDDDRAIILKGKRSRFRLPVANAEEFPRVPQFEESAFHELPSGLLKELIRRTVYATDPENTRYALGGVLLEMEVNKIIAVATDGRRLARMEGDAKSVHNHQTTGNSTIVPTKTMQLLDRALLEKDATVAIAARTNDLLVHTQQWTIFSRLVEGRYPNWRQVFPKRESSIRIELSVGPFFAAIRQAAIVSDHESRGIDLIFDNGILKMENSTANVGESHVELPIAYTGSPLTVTLDHRYVSEYCKVLQPESMITLELESRDRPAVLTTTDGYAYVIMPMAKDR